MKVFRRITLLSLLLSLCFILFGCSGKKEDLRGEGFDGPIAESQVIDQTYESTIMEQKLAYRIYLPKGYGDGTEYPVWYGLHGFSANETMWTTSGIGDTADELIDQGELEPMIMVFPFVKDASMKEISADMKDGKVDERKIDRYLCEELIPYIDSHYYTKAKAKSRYIGGFSMGGMMSLRIAFHHTDLFSKVGGYSAAVPANDYSDKQLEEWLFPNDNFDEVEDIVAYDKKKGLDKLNVYIDSGNNSNEPFFVGLQSLYEALQKRGIQSEYQSFDGGHTLRTENFGDYLKFYAGKK